VVLDRDQGAIVAAVRPTLLVIPGLQLDF
jgi:hypothetical protein